MSGKDHFEAEPFDPEAYDAFKSAVASRGSRPSIPNDAGIEAPEEIAERGRAMFRRALMQADADDLQEDLRQMLEALGMSDHARPYSPHRVFQEALNEMKRQLAAVPRSAAMIGEPAVSHEVVMKTLAAYLDQQSGYVRSARDDEALSETGRERVIARLAALQDGASTLAERILSAAPTTSPEPDAVRALMSEVAEYLTKLEGEIMAIDADMKIGECLPPSVYSDRILAALSRPAHGGWEDISTAPKDGTWVLVWEPHINTKYHPAEMARFLAGELRNSAGKAVDATHWQPAPAGPIPRNDRGSPSNG